ncbi:phenylalanine--tRNA ligase subunit beta [Oceanomicrobium pacificus]|uniref:Phenylalanine--tRNA ligase beta subunit n=1 Tax=Oceanomicrobium pacificus TaxID=2692916 RepID=A0A6B0TYN9_9RHOB|nr:phenylalanine--tRNA ligase subunit beta [Oceanomicrobium pacificus]MXU64021.1 phenylalanine--tRNA ligase subunit beta [Oceanomicrobium pacificus]
MKFTLSWLKEHLETDATLEEILYALTDLGLEVEGVEDPAERLGTFRVGEVIAAEKHPDADKLKVCTVRTATGDQQIICGAPNARAGIKVVVAQPGDYIPGIDTVIKVGKIRGVESFGMMCSERELELSDEHDGIIELGADAEVGQRYIDYAKKDDPVIEIAITPNRPDALGIEGIARDLAARGLGRKVSPAPEPVEGTFESPIKVHLDPAVADKACPLFVGRLIRGVKNGPSPQWLQDRLRAIGLRPISALVDITNYLTYDRNRPLHVFDADKVKGDITVRFAKAGETLTALDEKDYTLDETMLAVCDEGGAESIGGIMGGLATGCTEETVNVFVESAYWDPITIAQAGRQLRINSDARYRFERGVDPDFTPHGIDMATKLILDLCGGTPSHVVSAGAVPDTSRAYKLDPTRVVSLVGMDIPEAEQVRILTDLGFGVAGSGDRIEAWVPSWRPDVLGEADLVEEIARVASLTKLKGQPMRRDPGVARPVLTPAQLREQGLRRTLAALGYNECVTYSFIDAAAAGHFGGGQDATKLANPISSEMSHMRPDLLPGLLQAAARNQARSAGDLALFEVGPVFSGGEAGEQALQGTGLLVGASAARNPFGTRRPVDLYDAKADAEAALAAVGAPAKLMVMRRAPDWFHPGRSAVLSLGPKNGLAVFGELHPRILDAFGVKGPAVAFTIFPDNVPAKRSKSTTRPALDISDFQPVDRDFAFVVDAGVEAEQILRAAQGADKALIADVSTFDVFDGEKAAAQMGAGKKSVAITVRLQPRKATLTDAEIEAVSAKIVAGVTKATGASLRG